MAIILSRLSKSKKKVLRKWACDRVMAQIDPQIDYDPFSIPSEVDAISVDHLKDDRYRIWCPVKLSQAKCQDGKSIKFTKRPVNRIKTLVQITMKRLSDGSFIPPDIRYREIGISSQPKSRWKYNEAVDFCRDYPQRAKTKSKRNPPKILQYPCGTPMLGIVLPVNRSGLVAWDIDGCFDDQGSLSPAVEEWVRNIRGYIEKSPSGRGLRGFFLANLLYPRAILQHPKGFKIEIFSHGPNCWVTFTGNAITSEKNIYRQDELEEEIDFLYIAQQAERQEREEQRKASAKALKKTAPSTAPSPLIPVIHAGVLQKPDEELVNRIGKSKYGEKFRGIWDGSKKTFQSYGYFRMRAVQWLLHRLLWWTEGDVDRTVSIALNAPIVNNSVSGKIKDYGGLHKLATKTKDKMTYFKKNKRQCDERIMDLVNKKREVTMGILHRYLVRKNEWGFTDEEVVDALDRLVNSNILVPAEKVIKYRKNKVRSWSLATANDNTKSLIAVSEDDIF